MSDIALPASVTKDDLREIVKKRGAMNRESFKVADQLFAPGELILVGFAGALNMKSNKYDGEYRFRLPQPKDDESDAYDFNTLPGLYKKKPAKKKAEVMSDVVHAHVTT